MIAMNLLQSKITEFRSRGAEDLSVTTTPVYATTGELRNGVIEWTITRPELNNESWKQVIVSVGWDSMTKSAQAHTRTQDCEFSKTVLVFISQA
jgi:esterase/lipase superfamily enzyme